MGTLEKATILVVDDEPQMRMAMETAIGRMGCTVISEAGVTDALATLEHEQVDVIVTDLRMPESSGLEFLAHIRESFPKIPVILITAYGTIADAVSAMKNGAFDFLTKPFSAEDLETVVRRALRVERRVTPSNKPRESKSTLAILTQDRAFKAVLEVASSIAASSASVLIQGESGTGKELLARLIHSSSRRAGSPFVAVNCAALPGNLLESELFGHERGAFTGAVDRKQGKFEQANGGTILLDEISEMEEVLQAKLLRVLQEREIDRVGGTKPIPVDVRVLATTNRDIRKSVENRKFRDDLYYRLNVIPLYVPPLRDRRGDVPLLVDHFLRKYSEGQSKTIPAGLIESLERYTWPGNVRELENACQRAVLLSGDGVLQAEHFLLGTFGSGTPLTGEQSGVTVGLSVAEVEKRLILETLRATGNNKTKAAELLGISIRTLRNKLHEYGSEPRDLDSMREDGTEQEGT